LIIQSLFFYYSSGSRFPPSIQYFLPALYARRQAAVGFCFTDKKYKASQKPCI
jgi:hypothetical protein